MDAFSVSFILPRGWSLQAEPEWVNIMTLVGPNGSIDVARVRAAIDPTDRNGYEIVEVGPTAADFVAWLVEHPHIESTTPVPVTIAGYAGLQLDVRLRYVGEYRDRTLCGGSRCLSIIQVTEKKTSADRLALVEGSGGDRLIILDVDNVRVLVIAYPKRAEDFDAFMTEAEPVIGALMFR